MKSNSSLIKNLLTAYKISPKYVYLVFISCFLSAIVDAYLLKIISDFVILIGSNIESNISNIQIVCIKIFFSGIISGSLRVFLNWLIPETGLSIAAELSNKTSLNISKVEFQIINKFSKSELVDTLTTQKTLSNLAIRQSLFIIFNFSTLITIFSMAVVLAPKVMIFTVLILSISYLIIYKSISKTITKYSRNYSVINTKLLSQTSSLIDNLLIYNLFPIKRKFHQDIFDQHNLLRKTDVNTVFLTTSPRFAIESIGIVLLAIIPFILITGDKFESHSNILKSLGVLAYSVQKLLPAAQGLYSCLTDLRSKENSLNRFIELYKLTEKAAQKINFKNLVPFDILQIDLKNAFIKPSKKSKLTLKADININKGDSIAIIGKTGAGKSTFINALICNYPLQKGELFVNQKRVVGKSKFFHSYRASISYVPQTSRIINGGIFENITFQNNRKSIDNDFFEECCNVASLDSGLQDYLESNKDLDFGKNLSGGQIQRIAIARALYQKSSVLILDEATSALDRKTQERILSRIIEFYQNKILITVTHRIETLEFFNKIFEIKEGFIKERFYKN